MATILYIQTKGLNAMGYSIQLNGDIIGAIVNHFDSPLPTASSTIITSDTQIGDVKLGMKYVEADGGFYELDENGDIINESFIAL